MTINSKFRREITEEARDFLMYFRLARAYGKAGNPSMAKRIIDAAPVSTRSPEGAAQLLQRAVEAIQRIQARDYERRLQGLPPLEPKPPEIH